MSKKRVLIVTQYFYPENFRINELAYELVNEGYVVDALVGIPNYPKGTFFEGYGIFKKRHEVNNGVNIYRCYQVPRGTKGSKIRLSLNYLSFVFFASLWVLFFFAWKKKYDAIIAFEPSPITLILPAILLGKIRRTKILSWIQDIWPDSVTDSETDSPNKLMMKSLSAVTEYVYRHSDMILVSSPGMKDLVCRNHDYSEKIEWVPNWSDDFLNDEVEANKLMPEGYNIVMAGSINDSIGIDYIVKLIEEFKTFNDINWVFIGGGSKYNYFNDVVKDRELQNVYLLGMHPYDTMPSFYVKADAMLLSLVKSNLKHLDVTIPSRLQSYMSAGKPVFAMIGSGARNVIEEANCGFVVESGDYKSLAKLIKDNYRNKEVLSLMGTNARKAYEKYFTINVGTQHFEDLINRS